MTTTGCDGDGTVLVVGPAPDQTTRGVGTISMNHGHVAVIGPIDLDLGRGVQMDIRGAADHSHIVVLTPAEVVEIADGRRVVATTTIDQSFQFGLHSHTVTFN